MSEQRTIKFRGKVNGVWWYADPFTLQHVLFADEEALEVKILQFTDVGEVIEA